MTLHSAPPESELQILARTLERILSVLLNFLSVYFSSYYNLRNKVSDIQHGVLLLGFNQIYQIIISDGLGKIMPNTRSFREIQYHSIIVSSISYEISLLCELKPVTTSTISLLHDIGKSLVLLLKEKNPNF